MRKIDESAEQCPDSVLNLFLKNIRMSKDEFDEFIDMGPRHLYYDSPTFLERIIRMIFRFEDPKFN